MSRIKRGVAAHKRRKYLLARAKGFLTVGSTKFRYARERLLKAEDNAYKSRRLRKRDFRSLWITRINGALDQIQSPLSYSVFIRKVQDSGLNLNRKSISEIAVRDIEAFRSIVESVSK